MKSPSFRNIFRLFERTEIQTVHLKRSPDILDGGLEFSASTAITALKEKHHPPSQLDTSSPLAIEEDCQEHIYDTVSVFLFLGITIGLMVVFPSLCLVSMVLLSLSATLPLALLYAIWVLVVDSRSPELGGWGSICGLGRTMMNLPIWENYRNYFNASLIKTTDLPSDRNYVFAGHPHGVYCLGLFANILSNQTRFNALFPGIQVTSATLPVNFWLPGWREFMLSLGFVSCERNALKAVIDGSTNRSVSATSVAASESDGLMKRETGRALFIAVGGAEEFLLMEPGTMDLVILKRKGFVKMAMTTGTSLVPVITFGENDYVNRIDTPFTRTLAKMTQRVAHFVFPVFEGRWGTAFPRRSRLTTVVGEPLHTELIENPTDEEVTAFHAKYLACLQGLYDQYKDVYFKHRKREMAFVK
ncbi:hypothetical protein CcCBS67573_g09902 [Chytriomyces confervae]|uniref:Diacylglycerol O-acyltransferase n=1 Tax=Chytriomyces confervae TaxID=246404 RepID=A0A507DN41_9FUNG|nr:hypothetical protein CcCBS67573_g09902 [Chytriomyces confervae]